MMGAIGTGNIQEGVVTVSLGTSGTLYAFAQSPVIDSLGEVAAFCDSTDHWLPLVCTMNVTVATEQVRSLFAWNHEQLEEAVSSAAPGADGLLFLPYLNGERTPNLPGATGVHRQTLLPLILAQSAHSFFTYMLSLKRIFGGDDKFYNLLEIGADEAKKSAKLLKELVDQLGNPNVNGLAAQIAQTRRDHKRHSMEVTKALCSTFVTPLEREDIEALNGALYRIPKTVEKIGERLSITPQNFAHDIVRAQATMLVEATEIVGQMVRSLRKKAHVEQIQTPQERLQTIEGDADKLMVGLLRELYQGNIEAKEAMILKDLYELLEKAIDRCRDVGNVVFQVALKSS